MPSTFPSRAILTVGQDDPRMAAGNLAEPAHEVSLARVRAESAERALADPSIVKTILETAPDV